MEYGFHKDTTWEGNQVEEVFKLAEKLAFGSAADSFSAWIILGFVFDWCCVTNRPEGAMLVRETAEKLCPWMRS